MRKLFSFIMVALMSVMTLNAETTRIYCKMAQSWWKADGAAVGCHSWGSGPGTNWPGVRMTPVEGETDMWYIDLNTANVQNVIFTRVNASGAIADWGAKTKDLTIPVNGDNLFTITSSSAVWGDPGCDGTWSKYEVPVPTEPAVTEIEIEGDMSVAGSELTFWVTVSGFDAEPIVTFAVKAGEGEYEQLQRNKFTPTATGNYTVKATAINRNDEKGIYEEAYKEVDFTIGTPAAGITVNVTVPAGTPACYFYGEMSNNSFVAMTKVDETHYTLEFPTATTIGWGYKFTWDGTWDTENTDPSGDFKVEPTEGVINVEVKAWKKNPGAEYKYTTYTEWQVKFGPKWDWLTMTKQEDGIFTIDAVWGTTTGMNIASGDNPIKQDWYPLGDAALTVEEDVAEGDNVVITLTVVNDNTVALHVAKAAAPAEVLPQITEAPKSWAGEYVITAMKDENTALVWTGIDAGQCRVEASVVDKKLTDDNFVKVVVEALQDGGYSIKVKGGTNDGKYITQGATPAYKNALAFVNNPARVEIAMNDKGLVDIYQVITEEQTMYLLYNAQAGANNERFRFYKGSNYGQSNYYSLTLFGTPAPQPVGTFDLTIVQDTLWSKDGAKVAAWIWGEELAGQWTSWATNTNDTLTLKVDERADSIILVRNAPEATEPTWDAWNRIDAGEIDDCHIYYILDWNAGAWCERPQPVGEKYYITGNEALCGKKAWDAQAIEMTDGTHTFEAMAAGEYEMKITNGAWEPKGQSWGSAALSENCSAGVGDKDGNIHFIVETPNNVVVAIAEGKVTVTGTFKKEEPVGTFDLTIVQDTVWSKDNAKVAAWIWGEELAGQWTSWATNTNDTLTLKVDERADSIILVRNAPEATEPTWDAWNRIDAGEIDDCHIYYILDWNAGVWCERPQPVGEKYYITGNEALCGKKAWDAQAIEMTDGTHTFEAMAAGEYEMKITNGAWDPEGQSWGSADLSENCSAGVGDKDGNIHFIVETPNNVVVTIAEGKVTVTGTFKKEEPVGVTYYLVGYINGANVGCDEDYETLPEEYKFVNGSLTTTFTQTSYVFVKTGDNNHWYLSENYVEPAKQVTAILANGMDYGEKVGVNANIEVTFTLTENADGTITLSYAEATSPTSLEAIMLNGGMNKFMLDGQMYILRNNHLFNAAGNLLK